MIFEDKKLGRFGLVVMKTIVFLYPFLPCIPLHNVMKSKLPLTKQIGVVHGKEKGED